MTQVGDKNLNFKVNQFRYLPKRTGAVLVIVRSLMPRGLPASAEVSGARYLYLGLNDRLLLSKSAKTTFDVMTITADNINYIL